jgi:hypothetical protein
MTDERDDLGDLLAPTPGSGTSALRDSILRQTESRLLRDRWLHRGTRAVLIAAIFAAGGLAGWLLRPERERVIQVAGAIQTLVVPVPVPVSVPETTPTQQRLSAAAAELQAEQQDDATAAAVLYRQAGDAFLREHDYPNATRCYRLYLTRGGDSTLALAPDDSWLLVSLKNSAFKEKLNVTKNDG